MTPYYSDGFVEIFHGDAQARAGIVADHILTDPPYSRSDLPCWELLAAVATDSLKAGGWLLAYSGQSHLPEVLRALDVPALMYRWTLAASYEGGGQMPRIGDMTVLTEWKPVLAYRRRPFGSVRGPRGQFTNEGRTGFRDLLRRGGRQKDVHPWAQPLGEAMELITRFTAPGDTILDPFAGSGTFLVAAKALGRKAIGIEIEERWCAAAAEACGQETLGLIA